MSLSNCKAITKTGEQCKLKANSSGYCHIHNPDRVAEREAQKQSLETLKFEIPARRFSQRRGLKPISEVIQLDSISKELRNSLWNILSANFLLRYSKDSKYTVSYYYGIPIDDFITYLWINYFKYPLHELPEIKEWAVKKIFEFFENCEWYEIYDLLEVMINYFKIKNLLKEINFVLERELSGYRFVGGVFTDITNEQEIEMLEQTIGDTAFPAVSNHLKRSLALMSDKENPDYRNSIKESISAVESLAKSITKEPKATLGDALKILESYNKLHPALKKSFLSLYGYTNDEGGIRHAMLSEPELTANDAKFFLLSCTSFIHYLKTKI